MLYWENQNLLHCEVFIKSETPHNVCLCKYHENKQLMLDSVHKHIPREAFQSISAFTRALVCSTDSPDCMLNQCETCCDAILVQNIVNNFPEEDNNIQTTWYAWDAEGRFMVKTMKTGNIGDVLASLLSSATTFLQHCFVKRNQSAVFHQTMTQLNDNAAMLQIDFAENYTIVNQDEIQAAHWNSRQITVFSAVGWMSGKAVLCHQ